MSGEVVVPAGEGDVDELLLVAQVLGEFEEALVVVVPLEQQLLLHRLRLRLGWQFNSVEHLLHKFSVQFRANLMPTFRPFF